MNGGRQRKWLVLDRKRFEVYINHNMFMYCEPVGVFVYVPWLFHACAVRQVIIAFRFP